MIAQKPQEIVVAPVISNRPSIPSVKVKNVKSVHEFYVNNEGYVVNPQNGKLLQCVLYRNLPEIEIPRRVNLFEDPIGYDLVTFRKGVRKHTAYNAEVNKPEIVHRSEIEYLFPKDKSIKYAEQLPGLTIQKGGKFFYYKNQETGYYHIPRPRPLHHQLESSQRQRPLIPGALRLINPVDRPLMVGARTQVSIFYRADLHWDPTTNCLIDPLFGLPVDHTTSRLLDEKGLSILPHDHDHKLDQDQLISYPPKAMNKTALFKKTNGWRVVGRTV